MASPDLVIMIHAWRHAARELGRFTGLCLALLATGWSCAQSPVAADRTHDDSDAAPSTIAPTVNDTREMSGVETLTGARTRIVWARDLSDGTDVFGTSGQLVLMGYDSRDGLGERVLFSDPSSIVTPLITPKGDRVVFSDSIGEQTSVVDWDASRLTRLADGIALAVWLDPATQTEWVYVGSDMSADLEAYRTVKRYQIDHPEIAELVWDTQPVGSFQLSRDGRLAGAVLPWPDAGVIELPNGSWRVLGHGCWTALAPDDSHLFWYFDGSHRNLTIVDVDEDRRWRVNINDAPGIDGYEVYHPRWTNHPRFLTMTGPYTVGGRANKIRGGGEQVEIYVGRFAANFTSVERWVRLTDNRAADFFPDAWIEPNASSQFDSDFRAASVTGPPADSNAALPATPLIVEARVVEAATIPTLEVVAPYRSALLALEYEVVDVVEGTYSEPTIIAAHWIMRDGEVLSTAERPRGTRVHLNLEPYDARPELEGHRLLMDSDRYDLTLYYDSGGGS